MGKIILNRIEYGGGGDQRANLPIASSAEEGKIYQYTGATDSTYTNGYFYKCQEVSPATDPKTYEWVRVDVQPSESSGGANFSIDKDTDTGLLGQGNDYFGVDMSKKDSVGLSLAKPGEYGKNKVIPTKDYVDGLKGVFVLDTTNPCSYNDLQAAINTPKIVFIKHDGAFYLLQEKWENDEGTKRYVNIACLQRQGVDKGATYFFLEAVIADLDSPMVYSSTFVQPTGKPYTDSVVGQLSSLTTTDKSNIVAALNEVYEKSGEPFRIKQWANSLNVTIPTCTSDIANTSIAKTVFTIDNVEGAAYQIVGMIAYEVFDAASGGNRINCWPVCQFTGNGQKELSVRWMCGGTTDKVAKRINAWVLLKHR